MLVCVALSGQNVLLPWKPGALPPADLPRPVGPNHSGLTPQAGNYDGRQFFSDLPEFKDAEPSAAPDGDEVS